MYIYTYIYIKLLSRCSMGALGVRLLAADCLGSFLSFKNVSLIECGTHKTVKARFRPWL